MKSPSLLPCWWEATSFFLNSLDTGKTESAIFCRSVATSICQTADAERNGKHPHLQNVYLEKSGPVAGIAELTTLPLLPSLPPLSGQRSCI